MERDHISTYKPDKRQGGRFGAFRLERGVIDLLLNLRWNGWSHNAIAHFLGISRQLTAFYCYKYGIEGDITERGIKIPFSIENKFLQWKYVDGEWLNIGHSYREYLKMQEDRDRLPSIKD